MRQAETTLWSPVLDALRRAHLGGREARAELRALGLRRRHGATNWLYLYRHDGRVYCLKLYRAAGQENLDGRARAEREWRALSLLATHHYPYAPRPRYFAPDPAPAAVVLDFLPGRAIRTRRLTRPLLAALAAALRAMHRITPDRAAGALPSLVDAEAQQRWLAVRLRELAPSGTDPVMREALTLAEQWLRGPDPAALRAPAPLVFSRADANLANCLWDGRRIAIVDYEYSGWRDRAYDLADLVELDYAWSVATGVERASAEDWSWFLAQFDLSLAERDRLLAARRWLAWVWAIRAWPAPDLAPDGPAWIRFAAHLHRVRALNRSDTQG